MDSETRRRKQQTLLLELLEKRIRMRAQQLFEQRSQIRRAPNAFNGITTAHRPRDSVESSRAVADRLVHIGRRKKERDHLSRPCRYESLLGLTAAKLLGQSVDHLQLSADGDETQDLLAQFASA